MEELSCESKVFLCKSIFPFDAISVITQNWMTDAGHMDPYLMCSSCFECDFEEGIGLFTTPRLSGTPLDRGVMKNFFDSVVCNGMTRFDGILCRHLCTVMRVTTDL